MRVATKSVEPVTQKKRKQNILNFFAFAKFETEIPGEINMDGVHLQGPRGLAGLERSSKYVARRRLI